MPISITICDVPAEVRDQLAGAPAPAARLRHHRGSAGRSSHLGAHMVYAGRRSADQPRRDRRAFAARMIDWWFRDRSTGKIVVGQVPNAAIVVWLVTIGVRLLDALPEHEEQLGWIGSGALMVWGADELVRGVNPFRWLAGAVVLGWQVLGLLR